MPDKKEKRKYNKTILIIILFIIFFSSLTLFPRLKEDNELAPDSNNQKQISEAKNQNSVQMNANLKIEDLKVGSGAEAVEGKSVTVHYVGTLEDGTKFDSSYDRSQPFTFSLGAGYVIEGWEKGVLGMKVGGKRRLVIPPELGYGNKSAGSIPPNSTLIFEIELLNVE